MRQCTILAELRRISLFWMKESDGWRVKLTMAKQQKKAKRANVSAGILLFRTTNGELEFLLAHPGGPFWANRDLGAWTIPKGLVDEGEDLFAAACREFAEETGLQLTGPFIELGSIRQKAGKQVYAWACEGEADPESLSSNMMRLQYPHGSGQWLTIPEVDRYAWCNAADARVKLNPAQIAFIERLEALRK
jgi:predicted NUDIX family NTP pyrophosphohydrolase